MATVADQITFFTKPNYAIIGADPSTIGQPGDPIDGVYTLDGTIDTLTTIDFTVTTINGAPYPPPPGSTFLDTTFEIVDAVDPTVRVTFDAAGAAGTTATFRATQVANRSYTFADPGVATTEMIMADGAQTITGTKTINDTALVLRSAVDPTATFDFDLSTMAVGATASFQVAAGAAGRTYTFPDPGVATTEIIAANGTQTISGLKIFNDDAIRIVDNADATKRVEFQLAAMTAGATATMGFNATVSRAYTIPDSGADATFIMSEGAQTINGNKTFTGFVNINGNNYGTFVDTGFQIIDSGLGTSNFQVIVGGAGGVSTTVTVSSGASRVYNLSDVGANADFVMTQGAQSLTGLKTFVTGVATNTITERTALTGVTIDSILLRADLLAAPAIQFARFAPSVANSTIGIIPTGTGAIVADVPDNTAAGGNQRGANAIDFQMSRVAQTQVASGANSGILSGGSNTASSTNAIVCGGSTNSATSTQAFVGAGSGNTATASDAGVVAGTSNQANGARSFVGAGNTNVIAAICTDAAILGGGTGQIINNGDFAAICGGSGNITSGIYSFMGGGQTNTIGNNAQRACCIGGINHTVGANGNQGAIIGGNGNIVAQSQAGIVGGTSLSTTGTDSFMGGGSTNTINSNAQRSGIIGGNNNILNNAANDTVLIGAASCITVASAGSAICGSTSAVMSGGVRNFIGGGFQNSIGVFNDSAIIGGQQGFVAASQACVLSGFSNSAGGSNSVVGGDNSQTSGGGAIALGVSCIANASGFACGNTATAGANTFCANFTTYVLGNGAGSIALGNFASDAAAAGGGVPLGGLYRNGNNVQIRVV